MHRNNASVLAQTVVRQGARSLSLSARLSSWRGPRAAIEFVAQLQPSITVSSHSGGGSFVFKLLNGSADIAGIKRCRSCSVACLSADLLGSD